jgi:hypothetical protein
VQQLLYTSDGRPRISIISIAHLNDAERMFVVTLVANEVVAWMRRQPGTTSLRALLYMDEVFGFFPPSAMPPSKLPLLTLMKQARAFGIGVVLATQNPVDLDYKGLGNAGTWFIGRLQTERDKARVIEGLLGSEAAGGLDKAGFEALMSSLTQRTFLMRNVHDDAPVLFRTRWAMSYLRGPLTLAEIKRVTAAAATTQGSTSAPAATASAAPGVSRPMVQHGVTERFVSATRGSSPPHYRPHLGARVRTHYVDAKAGLDLWQATFYLAPVGANGPEWAQAEASAEPGPDLADQPIAGATFEEAPAAVLSARDYKRWSGALEDHVYRSAELELLSCPALKLTAAAGLTEGEFRSRVALALRERRDAAVEALRKKYAARLGTLEERKRRAAQKVEKEKAQASDKTLSTALAVGGSLLGALFGGGRRSSAISKASAAARGVSSASKERADVAHAEADVEALGDQVEALEAELAVEVARLESGFDPATIRIETVTVKARKADLAVEDLALVWVP